MTNGESVRCFCLDKINQTFGFEPAIPTTLLQLFTHCSRFQRRATVCVPEATGTLIHVKQNNVIRKITSKFRLKRKLGQLFMVCKGQVPHSRQRAWESDTSGNSPFESQSSRRFQVQPQWDTGRVLSVQVTKCYG